MRPWAVPPFYILYLTNILCNIFYENQFETDPRTAVKCKEGAGYISGFFDFRMPLSCLRGSPSRTKSDLKLSFSRLSAVEWAVRRDNNSKSFVPRALRPISVQTKENEEKQSVTIENESYSKQTSGYSSNLPKKQTNFCLFRGKRIIFDKSIDNM